MDENNQKSRVSVGTIFTTLVMLGLFCGLVFAIVWRRQSIPTAADEHREHRLKTLAELNGENNKIVTTYRWIDKKKSVVGIPIERAMTLVLTDLQSNKPHLAGPVAAPSPQGGTSSQGSVNSTGGQSPTETQTETTGDPNAGKTIFLQCTACHSLEPDENKTGPSLAGLFGRKAGSVEDFNYSDSNKSSGIVWDEDALRKYLPDPQKLVPGTKMAFPGLKDPKQVEDVIAYLKEATKK